MSEKPLIVQSDQTILLDVHSPLAEECRVRLAAFSELVKSPEHIHTFALTSLSIWNVASSGVSLDEIKDTLSTYSRFEVPQSVSFFIEDTYKRFGAITFEEDDDNHFFLCPQSEFYRKLLLSHEAVRPYLDNDSGDNFIIPMQERGNLKVKLIKAGFPVQDLIPLKKGEKIDVELRETTLEGKPFSVREYQKESFLTFYGHGNPGLGYGTIVLPCGSGKTIVGLLAIATLKTTTLILAPNVAAVHQWIRELKDKTTLTDEDIGEFTSARKAFAKVTVATYSMLLYRDREDEEFRNYNLIKDHNWGFVIYDEVHMLPAPVFRLSANLQAIYRLGLTATLVREDHREDEVFSLVGPKRYDVPWSVLEKQGFIARAYCHELRIPLPTSLEIDYAVSPGKKKIQIAGVNPAKMKVVEELLQKHSDRQILIIGLYLDQLEEIKKHFGFPLITGRMKNSEREELYNDFREKKIKVLIVSKVANFAIDLPDASVAIQVSGSYGSRQEEAQRLGRILRPKEVDSHFYTLVSKNTKEEDFSLNRQKFLSEQGYTYTVENWEE